MGWSMSGRVTEKLATDALEQAIGRESPPDDFSASSSTTTRVPSTLPGHSSAASSPRNSPIHVAAGQPIVQRARGILLQDAQARAGERQGLQDEGGGEAGRVQIHRALLQQAEDAPIDRL